MAIKGCKTIAEYAIRKWMEEQGVADDFFTLYMDGNVGILKDSNEDSMKLLYNSETKRVSVDAA